MLKMLAAAVALAIAAAPAAAQAVWDAQDLGGGGAEFRLGNDEGAAIILVCQLDGVSAGFEFPEPLDSTEGASIRAVPGERQNIAVAAVNDRVVRLTSGRGIEVLLRMLRNTANLFVRAGGERASFEVLAAPPSSASAWSARTRRYATRPVGSAASGDVREGRGRVGRRRFSLPSPRPARAS